MSKTRSLLRRKSNASPKIDKLPDTPERFRTIQEVVEITGTSESTIKRAIREGLIRSYLFRHQRLFLMSELIEDIKTGKAAKNGDPDDPKEKGGDA